MARLLDGVIAGDHEGGGGTVFLPCFNKCFDSGSGQWHLTTVAVNCNYKIVPTDTLNSTGKETKREERYSRPLKKE